MSRRSSIAELAVAMTALYPLLGCGDNRGSAADGRIMIEVDPDQKTLSIPARFLGASYETSVLVPHATGAHYFDGANSALVRTFETLGLRGLRLGGSEADLGPIPTDDDIQAMLDFVAASGVELIYTLRLRTFDPQAAAVTAKYLLDHTSMLTCLSLGNEADWYLATFAEYAAQVRAYESAIADPRARYCAPDSGDTAWVASFATELGGDGNVAMANLHEYFGGNGQGIDAQGGRDYMLSGEIVHWYGVAAEAVAPAGRSIALRLSETNSYANGGCPGASDAFASALWGLDYLHWWASHGAAAVNFHTGDHVSGASTTYSLFKTSNAGYHVHPLGYAVKSFDLGGHGLSVPVVISDTLSDTLAAYATVADGVVVVTIINKSHDGNAQTAHVTIPTAASTARMWRLEQTDGDVAALDGVTLGGATIGDDASWAGAAESLPIVQSAVVLDVPAASAAIVEISVTPRAPTS